MAPCSLISLWTDLGLVRPTFSVGAWRSIRTGAVRLRESGDLAIVAVQRPHEQRRVDGGLCGVVVTASLLELPGNVAADSRPRDSSVGGRQRRLSGARHVLVAATACRRAIALSP